MSVLPLILPTINTATLDVSTIALMVLLVFVAFFLVASAKQPVCNTRYSKQERRLIQQYRQSQNQTFLDNKGSKISQNQFNKNLQNDEKSWAQYLLDHPDKRQRPGSGNDFNLPDNAQIKLSRDKSGRIQASYSSPKKPQWTREQKARYYAKKAAQYNRVSSGLTDSRYKSPDLKRSSTIRTKKKIYA
jgi:hypothetical protein